MTSHMYIYALWSLWVWPRKTATCTRRFEEILTFSVDKGVRWSESRRLVSNCLMWTRFRPCLDSFLWRERRAVWDIHPSSTAVAVRNVDSFFGFLIVGPHYQCTLHQKMGKYEIMCQLFINVQTMTVSTQIEWLNDQIVDGFVWVWLTRSNVICLIQHQKLFDCSET